jgi:hypothetical protein
MTTPTIPAIPGFAEWVAAADDVLTGDPLWSMQAYRLGMYAIVCHNADRTERQATLIQVRRPMLTILRRSRSESALSALSDPARKRSNKKL